MVRPNANLRNSTRGSPIPLSVLCLKSGENPILLIETESGGRPGLGQGVGGMLVKRMNFEF